MLSSRCNPRRTIRKPSFLSVHFIVNKCFKNWSIGMTPKCSQLRRSGHLRAWWLYFTWQELVSVAKGFRDTMATTACSILNHSSTSLTLLSLTKTPPSTPDAVNHIEDPLHIFFFPIHPIFTGDFLHPSSDVGYGDLHNSTRTKPKK